jgi:hypothetical protein
MPLVNMNSYTLFRVNFRQLVIYTQTGIIFSSLSQDYDVGMRINLTGCVISYSFCTNKPLRLVPSGQTLWKKMLYKCTLNINGHLSIL